MVSEPETSEGSASMSVVETIETKGAYQLASNENPGAVIAQVQFNGDNFDEWAQAVRTALRVKKKFGFVDGSVKEPAKEATDHEDWVSAKSMVTLWILNTVEPKVRRTLANKEDPAELWKEIKERFSEGNGPRIQEIKAELAFCRQGNMSVIEYYGKLQILWEDLLNYETNPECKCSGCLCNLNGELEKKREQDRIHQFLLGLDDAIYGGVRASIISSDPLPNLNQVYSKVKSVERINTVMRGREQQTPQTAFVAQRSNVALGGEDKSKLMCTTCKKKGHIAETCYQTIGYPEWWGERARQQGGTGRGGGRGTGRGRGGLQRANIAVAQGAGETSIEAERNGFTGLTNEQWSTLIKILEEKQGSTPRLSGKLFSTDWVIDTGASNHMTGYCDLLTDRKYALPCDIGLPNGKQSVSREKGTVIFDNEFALTNVLFVPDLRCNLISVSQLVADLDVVLQIANKGCVIQDRLKRNLIGAGELREGLYFFRRWTSFSALHMNKDGADEVWHQRLGHPSNGVFDLLPIVGSRSRDFSVCDTCLKAKHCREQFHSSDNKSDDIFDMIHCDLWGPYRSPSMCNSFYFLTIVDDHSRGVWVFLLHNKAQVKATLRSFVRMVERQFQKNIKIVRSDNGTEFTCLTSEFSEQGIRHQTSCVGTPQQNGRVERKHRHILNVARALLFQSSLPVKFWGESILTAAYLINRTPSRLLKGKSPYELIYGAPPSYDNLRVFGCLAFAHNQRRGGDKFESRSRRCLFVGYPHDKKGWSLFDLETEEIFVSRDVVFVENVFPLKQEFLAGGNDLSMTGPSDFGMDDDDEAGDRNDANKTVEKPPEDVEVEKPSEDVAVEKPIDDVTMEASIEDVMAKKPAEIAETHLREDEGEKLGRGMREKKVPTKLNDYVLNTVHETEDVDGEIEMAFEESMDATSFYPISHYLDNKRFSPAHRAFLAAVTTAETEPSFFRDAVAYKIWRDAMQEEIGALELNETWDLVELPEGKTAIGCKWVYKIKFRSDGTVERYKARLVVLGNRQIEGVDYSETFAPVIKMSTIRLFLEVAAAKKWELHQMDVHNAFLHGDLEEEVYMQLPPGFRVGNKRMVCRLKKSLYGLKQAPRCWFAKLRAALIDYGFKQSYSDYSLFSLRKGGSEIYILVYVDDLVIGGNDTKGISEFKEYLSKCFRMKDLGKLKYFLGIEVARNKDGIFLCQRKYTLDIISDVGCLGAKPAAFPIEQQHKLALSEKPFLDEPERYRRLVGRLIYLLATRPDLTYVVHILSQFMQKPRTDHWESALRVVRYLKGTPGQGVLLRSDCDFRLRGWSDADFSGCRLTRRSLGAWFVSLGGSPISWKAKKQDVVSQSSAESEYRSMARAVKELQWLRDVLLDLGIIQTQPMELFCDNQAALYIAANPVFHERTKHIERDCHTVRDAIQDGTIVTKKVHTSEQLADVFTKALGRRAFETIIAKLGICNPYAPT